jgi:hypothetical protein
VIAVIFEVLPHRETRETYLSVVRRAQATRGLTHDLATMKS